MARINSTSSSLKKKKTSERKEERKTRWKRGEEEKKRDGRNLCGGKGKMENEMWKKRGNEGEGEERRG